MGALVNQRAQMIQEINSFVDGNAAGQHFNMLVANQMFNPIMGQMNQNQIVNPQLSQFNPLVTEDYKLQKIMEINSRMLEWRGMQGFYLLGDGNYNIRGNRGKGMIDTVIGAIGNIANKLNQLNVNDIQLNTSYSSLNQSRDQINPHYVNNYNYHNNNNNNNYQQRY
jgi:hypothetical protein